MKHEFGGPWTQEKLHLLEGYLKAYLTIFKGNPNARYFKTIYVDAFAGSGEISPKSSVSAEQGEEGPRGFLEGSASIALGLQPSFERYVFVEKSPSRCRQLQVLAAKYSAVQVDVMNEDANLALTRFAKETDWKRNRAVVFLDPYGMQVDWSTIQALADTRAVDLWILFPLSTVNRLLMRNELPPQEWGQALTRMFGTDAWRDRFYKKGRIVNLFEEYEIDQKDADFDEIGTFFLERLKSVFADVSPKARVLRNSMNNPLFLLCFASANEKGAKTAIKIASYLIGKK